MTLDYHQIRETTKKAAQPVEKVKRELTEKELAKIENYITDIEDYIRDMAADGKSKFIYDCSKLPEHIFYELVTRFKQQNPLFFMLTEHKIQRLTVDWTGKNEV